MVRIIELFEADLVLPKVLKPGETSDIDGIKKPQVSVMKLLDKLKSYQDTAKILKSKMQSDYIWTSAGKKAKTPEEKAAEMEKFKSAQEASNSESVQFIREIKNAMPFIERNCSKYLPTMHNSGFLYRGFKTPFNAPHSVFYGYPRADRRARDSAPELQIAFDNALKEMGVEALRRNSVFCSGSKNFADEYGLTFIIIPCNDAKFAWSKKHHDIILDQYNFSKFMDLQNAFDKTQIGLTKYLEEFQRIFEIDNRDLSEAIKSEHEIWFTGHYVAILATLEPQLRKMLFG